MAYGMNRSITLLPQVGGRNFSINTVLVLFFANHTVSIVCGCTTATGIVGNNLISIEQLSKPLHWLVEVCDDGAASLWLKHSSYWSRVDVIHRPQSQMLLDQCWHRNEA